MLSIGLACMVSSFAVGIQTAGDVQPITLIEAGSTNLVGDIDGNGIVDKQDAIRILEVAQGYSSATPQELLADPNRDGELTVSDALHILSTL